MYVCGMTGFTTTVILGTPGDLVFDVVQRWLRTPRLPRGITSATSGHRRQDHQTAQEKGVPIGTLTAEFIRAMDEGRRGARHREARCRTPGDACTFRTCST